MLLGHWHPHPAVGGDDDPAFAAHLHGRELEVCRVATTDRCAWHWRVASPHGLLLAEGDAATRDDAELAAEGEVLAVHPPTDELLERLLA